MLAFIFLFVSCVSNNESTYYKNLLKRYPRVFIDHFPKSIRKGRIHVTETGEYDVSRFFLIVDSIYNIQSLANSLKTTTKVIYHSNDTCLFIVNKFTTEKNLTIDKKADKNDVKFYFNSKCLINKFPVPNFWGLYENPKTACNLPEDFIIYVLDSKKGKFWDKNHRSNGIYMPEYWKHGYSKGVAINEKTQEIIYWFVLW